MKNTETNHYINGRLSHNMLSRKICFAGYVLGYGNVSFSDRRLGI
jgi:hypothetical protein